MEKRRSGEAVTFETRGLAHESVNKDVRYKQIISVLDRFGAMTAKEVAWKLFSMGEIPTDERNYTAPRLTELSQKGIVEPIGKKICSFTGKKVAVYALRKER